MLAGRENPVRVLSSPRCHCPPLTHTQKNLPPVLHIFMNIGKENMAGRSIAREKNVIHQRRRENWILFASPLITSFLPSGFLYTMSKFIFFFFPSLFGSVSLFLSQWALKTLSSTWKKSERKMIWFNFNLTRQSSCESAPHSTFVFFLFSFLSLFVSSLFVGKLRDVLDSSSTSLIWSETTKTCSSNVRAKSRD